MADLQELSSNIYYLPGGVNAAVVVNDDKEALLVDTGGDKDHGRRIKKACDALLVKPVAILNTHSHADHYGGNEYLVRNFGLPVYAPPFEASIMRSPLLEPVYLFNGAQPPQEMLSKWLLAKPSPVDALLSPGRLELYGLTLEIFDTSGHAHTHYSVGVGDMLLAADAVFGESVLDKYPLPFGQNIGRQRESAARVGDLGARVALPGHGDPTEDVAGLVEANLAAFERAANAVAEAATGVDTATVLTQTCDALGVVMTDLPRYTLNLCTVMAYLSRLREQGRVTLTLEHNALRWSQA